MKLLSLAKSIKEKGKGLQTEADPNWLFPQRWENRTIEK